MPRSAAWTDRKSTRLNSSHLVISYAVFCLKKKKKSPTQPSYATSIRHCTSPPCPHELVERHEGSMGPTSLAPRVGLFLIFFFFFNDTATTEIYTLSLHDALPICVLHRRLQGYGGFHRLPRDSLRSEEHTSELQSPCNLVCRLLLEKKKIQHIAAERGIKTNKPTWQAAILAGRGRRARRFFFFNDTATTEIYSLSLHDALPIYARAVAVGHLDHFARRGDGAERI